MARAANNKLAVGLSDSQKRLVREATRLTGHYSMSEWARGVLEREAARIVAKFNPEAADPNGDMYQRTVAHYSED